MTTVQDIYRFIDQVAPFAIQESLSLIHISEPTRP